MPTRLDREDYLVQMIEALDEIGQALGMDHLDLHANPDKARHFGWEAAVRIQSLIDATGTNPSTNPAANPTTEPPGAQTAPLTVGTVPDLDDPTVVAVFRLPIAVSHLLPLSNLMEKIYGEGLMTPSPGKFFVLRRPDTPTTSATAAVPSEESH